MSWLVPHEEEPTHEEFALTWVSSKSVFQVSRKLAKMGYVDMTPDVCLRWFREFRSIGIRLMPFNCPVRIEEANQLFLQPLAP